MEANKCDKLVIFAKHGGEDAEKATLPFVMGNAALAMDVKVTMVLQASGVTLATKGFYEHIFAAGFDPLKKLVDSFLEFGGTIVVCIPCTEHRKITADMLIPGAQPVKGARVIQEVLEAKNVLSY
jgi:predicted peroxiredoxin